jgi:glycine oxidase
VRLPAAPDVLVVGGGVIGCAIARAVARPRRSVLLVDRGAIGGEASSAAAGVLSVGSGDADGPGLALRRAGLLRFPALAAALREETGIDVELDLDGVMVLALHVEEAVAQRERTARRRTQGLRAEWLDADALRAAEPMANPAACGAGLYPDDGRVACERLVEALAEAARRRGASIVPGAEVHAAERRGDRLTRVQVADTWIAPGTIVLAAGAWAARVAGIAADLPVRPVRGQMLALRPPGPPPRHVLFHGDGCLTPRRGGEVLVGGTVEDAGFDKAVTAPGVLALLDDVRRIAPAGLEWPITRLWAGLRPGATDGGPFIGRHPDLRNLIVATGHYRNGILLAPVTADAVAATIEGTAMPAEVAPFGLP